MRREPALRVWMSLRVFLSYPGASKWGRNLRRTLDIIGREKKRGGAFTGAQAKSRKSLGMGVYFLTLQWGWDLLWREESAGQEEPEAGCYLKSLPISLLFVSLCCLCVMKLQDGRTIRCHPWRWPSTVWMSTPPETTHLSEWRAQLDTLAHCRSWWDKHANRQTRLSIWQHRCFYSIKPKCKKTSPHSSD